LRKTIAARHRRGIVSFGRPSFFPVLVESDVSALPPNERESPLAGRYQREASMRTHVIALVASGVLVAASSAAMAHHSFAMFDQANPIELEGIVQEFKYTNPHSYLLLEIPPGSPSAGFGRPYMQVDRGAVVTQVRTRNALHIKQLHAPVDESRSQTHNEKLVYRPSASRTASGQNENLAFWLLCQLPPAADMTPHEVMSEKCH
jgi:hypothetical protein